MKTRLSPKQKNTLHWLSINLYAYDSLLTYFQKLTYTALEQKGMIELVVDDEGKNYWELK